MTKRESILAAIKSSLTSVTGVSDASVFRSRVIAFARRELPAIVVEPLNDSAESPAIHRSVWTMTFQVAVLVRADTPETTADAIVESVHSKIMNSATVAALVDGIFPVAVDWTFADSDVPTGVVSMNFQVTYQTSLTDIAS